MAKQIFAANKLTGGVSGSLDDISYTALEDGNIAVVIQGSNNVTYFYKYDASNSDSESSPEVIIPDDNGTGSGRWILEGIAGATLKSYDTLVVDGISTLTGNVNAGGDVNVTGDADVTGSLTAADLQLGGAGATADEISTDGTLAGDSDTAIPTEKAVKTYADALINPNFTLVKFTSGGTWTKDANLSYIEVWIIGAGGGGGGVDGQGSNTCSGGGGGGAGGCAYKKIDAASLGATETVTIGSGGAGGAGLNGSNGSNGGASSFGSHISASGGGGGTGRTASTAVRANQPGDGGAGSSGDLNYNGAPGTMGVSESGSARFCAGNGGASFMGGGPRGTSSSGGGSNGDAPGSGGAGAAVFDVTNNYSGGDGADGYCIVKEYYTYG